MLVLGTGDIAKIAKSLLSLEQDVPPVLKLESTKDEV